MDSEPSEWKSDDEQFLSGLGERLDNLLHRKEQEQFQSADPDLETLEGITAFVQSYAWPHAETEAKVLDAFRDQPEVYSHFKKGALAFHREDFKAARDLLSGLPAVSPFIDYLRAEVEFLQGNVSAAMEIYNRILEHNKDNIPVLMSLSYVHTFMGNGKDQIAVLDRVIDLNPDFDVAWRARGFAHLQSKEYPSATVDFRKAIELVPSDVGARFGLARSLYCDEDLDDALDATLVAQQWDPQSAQIAFHLGLVYDAKELHDRAIEAYRNAARLCDGDAKQKLNVLWHLADDLLKIGNYDDACCVADDLIGMGEVEGHLFRAEALLGMREFLQAESDCRLYLSRDSDSPAAWELLGKICERQGKKREAQRYYHRAAEEFMGGWCEIK